jgi:hypothetical protein
VPLQKKFPEAPQVLLDKPVELRTVPEDNRTLSGLLETVTLNYGTYYECKARVEGWQFWYDENKKIYEESSVNW